MWMASQLARGGMEAETDRVTQHAAVGGEGWVCVAVEEGEFVKMKAGVALREGFGCRERARSRGLQYARDG